MRTRLVPYTPFGAKRAPLPDALEAQFVTPLGELPTASVHYHRQGVNAPALDGITELAFEYWGGSSWVEPPSARFLSMTGSFDHLEDTPTRNYSFVGIGWMLRRAKVWAANGLPIDADGKVQFLSANAGTIMATLIQNAKSRGWGAGIQIDFSATKDSAGQSWAKVLTIAYDLELDLEAVLSNLYQQGVCDYRWEGRTLRIFNPDTAMGRDLTVGAEPLRLVVADGQTSAPEDWTNEDLITDALVIGEEGKKWTFANDAAKPLGRLETVITQGGVSDPGTASLLADQDLLKGSVTRISYTREFQVTDDSRIRPFQEYQVGDWVWAQRGTNFERLRVQSISLTVTPEGLNGHAVLGDRLEDLLTKLAKRTKGITGGASSGGNGTRPAPEGPDTRTPAAPSGLVVGVDTYVDGNGLPQGRVDIDWAHSGQATNGTAMTIDRHQVFYRINETGRPWAQLLTTPDTEAAYSPLPVFKGDGVTPQQYGFKVRAVGDNAKVSAWTAVVAVTMEDDVVPPPVPEFRAEDLTTWLRTVTVRVTGKGAAGEAMPRDFSHFNAYQGASATGPWTLAGSKYGAEPGLVYQSSSMPKSQTVWFHLTSVDRSGNESAPSVVRSVIPTARVDVSEIVDKINAGEVLIENANKILLQSGVELGEKLIGLDTSIDDLDGDLEQLRVTDLPALQNSLDDATGRLSTAESEIDTVQGELTNAQGRLSTAESEIDTAQGELTNAQGRLSTAEGQITTAFAAIDATTKYSTLPAPATADGYRVGNTWRQVDGAGNVIAEWRVSSNLTWAPQKVTSAMVSNLEVGKLVAGTADIISAVAQKIAASTASFQTADIKNLFVTGEALLSTVVSQRIAASTASFQTVDIKNLFVTGEALLSTVVSQRIAASTASFQTADIKNLFVTGTTSMNEAVARRIAAESGVFLELGVDQLTAGTANIGEAVVDKFWADFARLKSVSTDMLRVGNGNLILDPSFVSSRIRTMRLALSSSALSPVFTQQANGLFYMRGSSSAATGADYYLVFRPGPVSSGNMISVTPGEEYSFEVDVWADTTVGWLPQVDVIYGNGSTGSMNLNASSLPGVGGNFQRYTFGFVVPDGVAEVYPRIRYNSGSSGFLRLRAPSFKPKVGYTTIMTGGVLADHLTVTEEMTAKIAQFLHVSTDMLDANAVTADKADIGSLRTGILTSNVVKSEHVDADAITAKHKITGALFQTNAAALTGIKIDQNYLRSWNASGNETLRITSATGDVTLTGGTVQTTATANRGVKLNATGLHAWDDAGNLMFDLGTNGIGRFTGRLATGPSTEPGATILPPSQHGAGYSGYWLTKQAGVLGGSETAGMWLENPGSTIAQHLQLRGLNGGGVNVWGRLYSADMYAGSILGPDAGYRIRAANGSYFTGSLEARGQFLNPGMTNTTFNSNVYADSTGRLWLASSASRFKADQKLADLPDSLLDVPVKDWVDKGQLAEYQRITDGPQPLTETEDKALQALYLGRVPGVIAEEVEAAGGSLFVSYNEAGQIEQVADAKLALARTSILKRQLDKAINRINALEGAV